MEDIHNFNSGLHSDFDAQNQPPNTYREAYNWIRLEDGSLVVENGTVKIDSFPIDNYVVHMCPLGEEVIVFSWYEDEESVSYGEIGVVDNNYNYTMSTSHSSLDFRNKLIKAEARVDYRGHRLVYFIDINGSIPVRKIDLDSTYLGSTIEEETRLFLTSNLPIVKATSITEDGSIPTGIYQFSTRLLTSSLNKTATSLLTNIVPITNETVSSGTEAYDGALPQTPSFKSINLEISNIDTKYKFLEIICTTYESLTNTVKSNVIATKLITGTTMNHKYSSLEDNGEEVLLDEITIEPLELDYPKAITQKDGSLLLGNLEAKKYDYDFQTVANNAIVRYIIKELDYNESININGSYSTVNTGAGIDVGSTTSEFDNYKSELYTTDFRGYQRDEVYSFALVPIFKNGSYGSAYHIPAPATDEGTYFNAANTTTKLLGTQACETEFYPTDYGYPEGAVRYHKMPNMEQEPIFASGKIRVLGIEVEYDLSILSEEEQANITGIAIVRELRTEENKSILAQGIVNPLADTVPEKKGVSPFAGKSHWDYLISASFLDYDYSKVAFYSPETTILRNNMKTATHIKPVASISGNSYRVGDELASADQYAHWFLNYANFSEYNHIDVNHPSSEINRNTISYIDNGDSYNTGSYVIDTVENNGFLFFETKTPVAVFFDGTTKDRDSTITNGSEIAYEYSPTTSKTYVIQEGESVEGGVGWSVRNLFNLIKTIDNPYGSVLDKEYVLVDYKLLDENSYIECFGGDIFINKTSMVSTTRAICSGKEEPIKFRTLSYYFCESTVNTAYRHFTIDNGIYTTVPYYPKSRVIFNPSSNGILNFEPMYGHANGYNKQYSFENTLKKFYSKSQFTEEEVTRFENRVIYSEQSIEGEQFDSYRLFLTNNYHDVPKNKGSITNLFVHQNDLMIHTSQSLWKSSFNERVTQISSAGEVVLGNGGKFSRPSLEMFPHKGGYAGSIDSLATISTPYGTFFIDRLQRKIFLLGSSFEDITNGLNTELEEKLRDSSGGVAVFDYKNDRVIFSGKESFTLSYYPKLKSFTSYHDYFPNTMTSVNNNLYLGSATLELLNVGNYGEYYGIISPSTITIVSNDNPLVSKTFDNIVIHSNLPFDSLEVSDENKTITKELVENDDWEFEPTITQQRITKSNSEYRVSTPLGDDDERIKGKYSSLKLDYSNLNNEKLIVKYLKVNYRANAR